jgi:hypothetical protein
MGRTESKQVVAQGTSQSAQDQQNAQSSLAATNAGLKKYSGELDSFMKFGRDTYGADGEFMRDQSAIGTTAAGAGSNALKGDLALHSMRTGENTAGYAPAVAEDRRARQRELTSNLAGADATRLQTLTNLRQFGVQASSLPSQISASLYGTGTSGAGSQLDAAGGAARTPGFWDTFAPALAQGAGTAIAGACPCAGSLIRLGDGKDAAVEALEGREYLYPLGFSSTPNLLTDKPKAVKQPCFEIRTMTGLVHRGSKSHTVALATGGYAYMYELLNRTVLTADGTDVVVGVRDIGEQDVYPMAVGGSHCYLADGIWILA